MYLNQDKTGDLGELRQYFPWRRKVKGTAPGMNNTEVNSRDKMGDSYWVWPRKEPSERHKQMMMARAAEIGTRTVFENFMFSFGGKNYLQTKGGPFGARITMCAARLVMDDWGKRYTIILLNSGLKIWWIRGYVDDGRQVTGTMKLGMRYQQDKKKFEVTEEGKREDEKRKEETGETDSQRMARVFLPAINDVNPELVFTVECADDFPEKRLPTLDFYLWVVGGLLLWSYFEKAMRSQLIMMKRSAQGEQQKMDILSNELVRRMSNICDKVENQEKVDVIDHYSKQLKNAGYS